MIRSARNLRRGIAAALCAALVAAGCQATRAGYETAPYRVLRHEGRFEVREYPALTLVQTPTTGGGADGGFMRLFRYISGRNATGRKIAMTTPVMMAGGAAGGSMAFVLPASVAAVDAPAPADPEVTIRRTEPGRFAVYRYRGGRGPEYEAQSGAKLGEWLKAKALAPRGEAVYAYFDPPWIPAFLRRNEAMLPLAPATVN